MSRRFLGYNDKGVDESPACYITDYIYSVECACIVVFFFRQKRFSLTDLKLLFTPETRRKSLSQAFSAFFLFMGLSYFAAGLMHQFWPHSHKFDGTPIGFHISWRLVLVFNAFATLGMLDVINLLRVLDDNVADKVDRSAGHTIIYACKVI